MTVNKTADTNDGSCTANDCSLREAIAAAAPGDTINFGPLFTQAEQTIVLNGTELVIDKSLVIDGPGALQLIVSGNNASRVFANNGGNPVVLSGMTIAQGNGQSPIVNGSGGAILNLAGSLVVLECNVIGSSAPSGGGISNGAGTLLVLNSTIAGNEVERLRVRGWN